MNELARRIREEITNPEGQLELFSPDERQQPSETSNRSRPGLNRSLEIDRETERIRSRYADADPRLFPFALVFVVPRSIAGGGL